jgi:hypothetical protein
MSHLSDRRKFSNFLGAIVSRLKARWRQWVSPDRYRPEKHYMRGPGPKNSGKPDNGSSPAS